MTRTRSDLLSKSEGTLNQNKFLENYFELEYNQFVNLRVLLRKYVLDGLVWLDGLRVISKDLQRPRVQFLYLHHVFKDEEKALEELISQLSVNHSFISYSEAVERILNGNIDKPYICFSSDDGFRNNLRAAEILHNYGISACFFINPAIVGINDYEAIKSHCQTKLNLPPVEFMGWDEIEIIQKLGHEIGSHSYSHSDAGILSAAMFLEDCQKSIEILVGKCGDVKHFAFPYGRFQNFNQTAKDIIFDSGFLSCASAERGCHDNPVEKLRNDELCIRRDHIVLGWKFEHIVYFLARNSRRMNPKGNLFPY